MFLSDKVKLYGIPPDIQYGIDCSVLLGKYSADVAEYNYNYNPQIVDIIDNFDKYEKGPENEDHLKFLDREGRFLSKMYEKWYEENPEDDSRLITVFKGVVELSLFFRACIEKISHNECGKDNDISSIVNLYKFDIDNINSIINRYRKNRNILEKIDNVFHEYERPQISYDEKKSLNVIKKKKKFKIPKSRKKALVKSANFVSNTIGVENVKIFLSGKEIVVEGEFFNYKLSKQKYSKLFSSSHGQISTQVFSKDDKFLCNVCIFTENVPVFDHLMSLIIHIKSNCEEILFKEGNLYNITQNKNDLKLMEGFVDEKILYPANFNDLSLSDIGLNVKKPEKKFILDIAKEFVKKIDDEFVKFDEEFKMDNRMLPLVSKIDDDHNRCLEFIGN